MAIDPIAVGIKRLITQKGLLQGVVARRSGFSERQFSDMMNDRRIIKACDLIPIASALNVEIAEIYSAGKDATSVSAQARLG